MTKPEQPHVAVRLDAETLARFDALASLLSGEGSGAVRGAPSHEAVGMSATVER